MKSVVLPINQPLLVFMPVVVVGDGGAAISRNQRTENSDMWKISFIESILKAIYCHSMSSLVTSVEVCSATNSTEYL